jgi:periplasmic copper chaperone A
MKTSFRVLLCCVALCSVSALSLGQSKSELQIEKPWARATVPGAAVGGGYLLIRNTGAGADRLVAVTSPASARVEIHEMAMEKDVMRMREVKGVDVPAKGAVEFKPGGYHLMFIELKAQLKQGESIPVTLRFEKAGEVKALFAVETAGARAAASGTSSAETRGHSIKH